MGDHKKDLTTLDESFRGSTGRLIRLIGADARPPAGEEMEKPMHKYTFTDDTQSEKLPVPAELVKTPVKKPERRDAARNRLRILEAARKLLQDRPISDICMDELAKTAGVGKGTLYRRFADRASLCRALLQDQSDRLQTQILNGFSLPQHTVWATRLETLMNALFDYVYDNAALLSEALAFERGSMKRFEDPEQSWKRDAIARYLRKGVAAGEIQELDAESGAEIVLAALDPDLVQYYQRRGVDRDTIRARFRRIWSYGLTGR